MIFYFTDDVLFYLNYRKNYIISWKSSLFFFEDFKKCKMSKIKYAWDDVYIICLKNYKIEIMSNETII